MLETEEEETRYAVSAVGLVVDDLTKGTKLVFSYSEIEECKALYILDTSPLLFSPKVFDTNTKTFRLEIDRDVFVGHPIHIREEDKKKAKESKRTKKKKRKMTEAIPELHSSYSTITSIDKKNVANVSLFNVVFALRDSDKEMKNTYTISDMSKCAEYISKTLLYEEKRCNWISNSVTSLSYHRERYDEENNTKQSWRSRALELSSLARELKDLYCQLNHKDRSHALDLKWHRWLKLSFVLSNPSRKEAQDSTFRP
eukprot:g6520.t1